MSVPSNRPATTIGVIVTMLLALNLLLPGASQSASQRFSVNAVNPHGKSVSAENLEPLQGYLDPAPGGMDVRFAWGVDGGKGQNVKIADIENDWNLNHIDLLAAASNLFIYVQGVDTNPVDDVNHGTAVLGELVAQDDGQGVTGIANQSTMGLINPQASASATDVAAAINRAAAILGPGDVILVEQQTLGLRYNPATGQGLVPIEFEPDVFAAIKAATSRGIVVIEPSSNGSENLDDAIYTGYFNRISHDSGAIVVGAGQASTSAHTDRAWFNESDYGLRVDVQGWGQGVATCGFGDVRLGTGQDFWYTTKFGGTSGAAAMVAGAAALLESIVKARNQPPLSPVALRQLLIVTGSGQAGDLTKHIGSRPDLKAAIAGLDTSLQPIQPVINSASYNPASGRLTIVGANFLPGNAIVRIDGMQVRKIKYPGGSIQPDGTATRIMTKGNITSMLPEGVIVQITVSNPATGLSSPMFAFSRP